MADDIETLFQFVLRYAELIRVRQEQLGAYSGDGPTSEQASALVEALRPISEAETVLLSILLAAFRGAVDAEMSWLFPERDPIGEEIIQLLRKIQDFTGKALQSAIPEMRRTLKNTPILPSLRTRLVGQRYCTVTRLSGVFGLLVFYTV
jgi:hypothetical protein